MKGKQIEENKLRRFQVMTLCEILGCVRTHRLIDGVSCPHRPHSSCVNVMP